MYIHFSTVKGDRQINARRQGNMIIAELPGRCRIHLALDKTVQETDRIFVHRGGTLIHNCLANAVPAGIPFDPDPEGDLSVYVNHNRMLLVRYKRVA